METTVQVSKDTADILASLTDDEISLAVKGDELIVTFIASLVEKYGKTKMDYLRQRARQLGQLMVYVHDHTCFTGGLREMLTPERFDLFIDSVKKLSTSGQKEALSLPLKLGHSVNRCLLLLKGESIRKKDKILKENVEGMQLLMELEWHDRVSSQSLKKLYDAKMNQKETLPTTDDIVRLTNGVAMSLGIALPAFKEDQTKETGRALAELALARIIIFNKNRGGDASHMKVKDYSEAITEKSDELCQLYGSLNDEEKKLVSSHVLVYTQGKKGRHVPVLLTKDMKEAVDNLIQHHSKLSIPVANPYIFATLAEELKIKSMAMQSMVMQSMASKMREDTWKEQQEKRKPL